MLKALCLDPLAAPLYHLKHLLAEAVLHSPALAAAAQLQQAALAEALALPEFAARFEAKAGLLRVPSTELEESRKVGGINISSQHLSM